MAARTSALPRGSSHRQLPLLDPASTRAVGNCFLPDLAANVALQRMHFPQAQYDDRFDKAVQ
jgi:hypothetical protein